MKTLKSYYYYYHHQLKFYHQYYILSCPCKIMTPLNVKRENSNSYSKEINIETLHLNKYYENTITSLLLFTKIESFSRKQITTRPNHLWNDEHLTKS